MTEYSNTQFTGYALLTMAASAVPQAVPITPLGDSTAHTIQEGEGLTIDWFRYTTFIDGIYNLYLSYDDDGSTQHVPLAGGREGTGWAPVYSVPNEYHVTYPAPAGKTWKVWALGPENYDEWYIHLGGTITNKQ